MTNTDHQGCAGERRRVNVSHSARGTQQRKTQIVSPCKRHSECDAPSHYNKDLRVATIPLHFVILRFSWDHCSNG